MHQALEEEFKLILAEHRALIENAEAKVNEAVNNAKDYYHAKMTQSLEDSRPLMNTEELRSLHESTKMEALGKFKLEATAGSEESQKSLDKVHAYFTSIFRSIWFIHHNFRFWMRCIQTLWLAMIKSDY